MKVFAVLCLAAMAMARPQNVLQYEPTLVSERHYTLGGSGDAGYSAGASGYSSGGASLSSGAGYSADFGNAGYSAGYQSAAAAAPVQAYSSQASVAAAPIQAYSVQAAAAPAQVSYNVQAAAAPAQVQSYSVQAAAAPAQIQSYSVQAAAAPAQIQSFSVQAAASPAYQAVESFSSGAAQGYAQEAQQEPESYSVNFQKNAGVQLNAASLTGGSSYSGAAYSGAAYSAPSYSNAAYSGAENYNQASAGQIDLSAHPQGETKVFKHVYAFAAPEEPQSRAKVVLKAPVSNRKHYKLVFIKAPSGGVTLDSDITLPAQEEEKTQIYVLSKQQKSQPTIRVHTAQASKHAKPDVFFVKYKNELEAQNIASGAISGQGSNIPAGGEIVSDGSVSVGRAGGFGGSFQSSGFATGKSAFGGSSYGSNAGFGSGSAISTKSAFGGSSFGGSSFGSNAGFGSGASLGASSGFGGNSGFSGIRSNAGTTSFSFGTNVAQGRSLDGGADSSFSTGSNSGSGSALIASSGSNGASFGSGAAELVSASTGSLENASTLGVAAQTY